MSPRRVVPQKKQPQKGLPSWLIVGGIVVVLVVVLVVGVDFISKATGSAPLPTVNVTASGRTEGDPKAPIAFMEFSDFQ